MKIFIGNAFSLSMLDREAQRNPAGDAVGTVRIPRPVDDPVGFIADWQQAGAEVVSVIGHADAAAVFAGHH